MKINLHLDNWKSLTEKDWVLLGKLTDPEQTDIPIQGTFHVLVKEEDLKDPSFPNFLKDRCKIIVWDKDLKQK